MRRQTLGYIEASKLELILSDNALRRAQTSQPYLSLGFEVEVEKEFGISIEGATRARLLPPNPEDTVRRVVIESDPKTRS